MKPSTIIIGLPKNQKLWEDTTPLRDALELEQGELGNFRCRFIPGAVFRVRRVSDIARFIKNGVYQLGVFCDDTALEEGLSSDPLSVKVATMSGMGNETSFSLLARDRETLQDILRRCQGSNAEDTQPETNPKILTSYPVAAKTLLPRCIPISVEGQTEAILANEEVTDAVGALDIVRSGETAASFGLVWEKLFSSRIGVWQTLKVNSEKEGRFGDVLAVLRERLKSFESAKLMSLDQGNTKDLFTQKQSKEGRQAQSQAGSGDVQYWARPVRGYDTHGNYRGSSGGISFLSPH